MRVTAVATWFPTKKSPASGSFIVKDLHAIAGTGVKIRLLHLVSPKLDDGTRHLNYEGIEVTRLPFNPFSPMDLWEAHRLLPHYLRGSDLVHSMAMSTLAPVAWGKPPLPWIHTEHWSGLTNPDTLGLGLRATRPAVLALERLPEVVTSVCPYLGAPLRKVRAGKTTVEIPCVVEPVDNLVERRNLSDSGAPWRLVSVGGLVERKDPLFALQVVAELQRRHRKVQFTWVGEGSLAEAARDYATKNEIDLRLPGALPYEGVSRELSAADVFIGPTHGDNFFVSCAEAILHGRPVVVGSQGGHPEYMREFVGTALPVHDASVYADAVEAQILENHASAAQIAASIGQAFSAHTVGNSYRIAYRALLEHDTGKLAEVLPSWRGW